MKRRSFLKTIGAIGVAISVGAEAGAVKSAPKLPTPPSEAQSHVAGDLTEYHWLFKYEHQNSGDFGEADKWLSQEVDVALRKFTGSGYLLIGTAMVISGYDYGREISWRRVSCMAVKT